jgi:hypothetical protein
VTGGHTVAVGLDEKAPDRSVAVLCSCPDKREIRDGCVRDPPLRAVQPVALVVAGGAGLHPGGVRAVVRLGETETADQVTGRQFRQEPLAL